MYVDSEVIQYWVVNEMANERLTEEYICKYLNYIALYHHGTSSMTWVVRTVTLGSITEMITQFIHIII